MGHRVTSPIMHYRLVLPLSPIAVIPRLYDLSRAAEPAPNACQFRRRGLPRSLVAEFGPPVLPRQYYLISNVTHHANFTNLAL